MSCGRPTQSCARHRLILPRRSEPKCLAPVQTMIAFIDEHRGEYGVEPICRVLPIASSTHHDQDAKRRDPSRLSVRARRDQALKPEIVRVFAENFGVYGVRKVWQQMRGEGFDIARCTVERLMRDLGLQGVVWGRLSTSGNRCIGAASSTTATAAAKADSTCRRNTRKLEIANMACRRASERCTREKLHSPGRPSAWLREHQRRFWESIARGRSSEEAAADAGISTPLGPRWLRSSGGMPPTHLAPSASAPSGRFLTFREREEIAIELAKGSAIRAIARKWGARPARSRAKYGATLPRVAAIWSTVPASRSGTLNEQLGARVRASWPATLLYARMSRSVLLAGSRMRMASALPALRWYGRSGAPCFDRAGAGRLHGARSRSPIGCGSITQRIPPCASATRLFTNRCTSRDAVPCAGN